MTSAWTPPQEIRRIAVDGGAMLYDASRASNFAASWFDPQRWVHSRTTQGEARGRGRTLFFEIDGLQGALRHYHRGGLMARLRGDRYHFSSEAATRPFSEFAVTWQLYARGLPVAAPIACRYRRSGSSYTADLITARVVGSETLAARLAAGPLALPAWVAVGRCIRRFHDVGACHADLNAHNLLLLGDETVYLIDFDRARLRSPGWWCDDNLVRLRRSLENLSDRAGPGRFSEPDWHSLLAGYRTVPERPRGSASVAAI